MSVVLTGQAATRIGNAGGFIEPVTDPSKFLSKMPFDGNTTVMASDEVRTLADMLHDKGNPVYFYKKDGTRVLQEYYKADYELALTSFQSAQKTTYNRILGREEALTKMIDQAYPDMGMTAKLELASLDSHANMDLVKKLWHVEEKVAEAEPEEVVEEVVQEQPLSYPALAEGGELEPVKKPAFKKPPVFKRQAGMTVNTPNGDFRFDNLIVTDTCYITAGKELLSDLEDQVQCVINYGEHKANVEYSGLQFSDATTGVSYTVFIK